MSDYEEKRLHALHQLNLLDTPPSESFDRITRMASQLFKLPVAAVSLTDTDRQWFKSRVGSDLWEVPRHKSPCSDVSASSEVVVIKDFLASEYYKDSPQAQLGLRFYAGAPLLTRNGYTLGTMCVLGPEPRSITAGEIRTLQDLSALVMAQIELQHAFGRVEPLTGLPNRSQFSEDLEDLARDFPGARRFGLFFELLDIVHLHSLNRVMGHTTQDELAQEGALHIQSELKEDDTLYHVGPCQYLFLRNADNESDVRGEALRLTEHLRAQNLCDTLPVMIRPAVGIAPFRLGRLGAADVLRIAQSACQDARQAEAPAAVYCHARDEAHRRRYTLLTDMRHAMDARDELRLVFQPRVALRSGRCVGAEALLRWCHPTLGEVSPEEFIPVIENSPLARPLTAWVLRAAMDQTAAWYHQGLKLKISMNVMASNLEEEGFTHRLLEWMAHWQLPLEAIELELTESALVHNNRIARHELEALRSAGISIAIDDFGTGYSSLAYLLKIPADVVKIDRAFTHKLNGEVRSHTLLEAMVALAHDLGFKTVAEGFSPLEALQVLGRLRCDEVQSFTIAKPLAPDAFERWLDRFGQYETYQHRPDNIISRLGVQV